jgi:two-component system, LuxR family, response regulator FixJ
MRASVFMDGNATVFVVNGDGAGRAAARRLLKEAGFDVHLFPSAETFLEQYDPNAPGCLLLEGRVPVMGGLELQKRLLALGIPIPVVVVSAVAGVRDVVAAMQAGALEFLEAPAAPERLIDGLHRALQADERLRRHRRALSKITTLMDALSRREREVLELIVAGHPTKLIAAQLGVSPNTIENQRANIFRKMQADSVADVVRMATYAQVHRDGMINIFESL